MHSPPMSPWLGGRAGALGAITSHIYTVVPVYNRKALLERFLNCMRRQTFRNFMIIVVDDGSTDGTSALIQENFPEVHLVVGGGNLWWTGAINLGIRHAPAQAQEDDAILIIDDDIEVDPDYLESLFDALQKRPNALVGSVLVDLKNPKVVYNGGRIVNWWTAQMRTLNVGKLHVDQTAGINTARSYSLRDLGEYFLNVKSSARLKYRFFFSYDTATNAAQFCCFLLCDFARITIHFLRRLRFKPEARSVA
jgi:glycosyltransferase involved in cell wall biosynthesis